MAVVKTIKFDWGPTVRIHDDDLEKDQEAAWKHAREVQAKIHYDLMRKKAAEQAAQNKP